jgi:hypothetical protein
MANHAAIVGVFHSFWVYMSQNMRIFRSIGQL